MKKFESILSRSGDAVMKDRASNVSKLAEMAQVNLVNTLEKKRIELEMKKTELLDMSPDNRYSLKPGQDFEADNWVNDYHNVCLKLINNEIALKTAEKTQEELFTEAKANK